MVAKKRREGLKREVIKTIFPERKFQSCLRAIGASSAQELGEDQVKEVFLQAISNFETGSLSLDELSGISRRLWWKVIRSQDKFDTKLVGALYSGGELTYYARLRRPSEKRMGQTFLQFLNEVLDFYHDMLTEKSGEEEQSHFKRRGPLLMLQPTDPRTQSHR